MNRVGGLSENRMQSHLIVPKAESYSMYHSYRLRLIPYPTKTPGDGSDLTPVMKISGKSRYSKSTVISIDVVGTMLKDCVVTVAPVNICAVPENPALIARSSL